MQQLRTEVRQAQAMHRAWLAWRSLEMRFELARMPAMNRVACVALLLAGTFTGCDEAPVAPPELLTTPPPPAETTSRPTTQELLEGPRRSIALGAMPLSVQAPPGWSVKTMDGTSATFLEGPTPTGDASIKLSDRAATKPDKLEILAAGAKKEREQFPDSIKLAEMRDIRGGAKVLERQRVGKLMTPALSEPGVKESPPFSWTITVFVPRGNDYETHELNFVNLTADQYETDKALLRGIVESIAVNGAAPESSAGGGSPVGAATAPTAR